MTATDVRGAKSLPPIVVFVCATPAAPALTAAFDAAGLWVAATSGDEAVETAIELKPDLLLLSADVPTDVLTALRTDPLTKEIPVLWLGGGGTDPESDILADVCLGPGADTADIVAASLELIDDAGPRGALVPSAVTHERKPLQIRRPSARACPQCAAPLEWVERSRLYGVEYDYFRWCAKGCGLYCYNRRNRDWLKLA
jgi:hypothetical protein